MPDRLADPVLTDPPPPVDVLLLQLGTPDEPTAKGLRPYLREFLCDRRVIEAPWLVRWLLVNGFIVPFRSPNSAEKYRRVWDDQTGSPLLSITLAQRDRLGETLGAGYRVHCGMRYGNPNIRDVVPRIMAGGCERLVVVPMFPQYSATTTASGLDGLFDALKDERVIPAMRVVKEYHTDDAYLEAVCDSIRRHDAEAKAEGHVPQVYIVSFHGIPIKYIKSGDPYMRQAAITGKTIARRMGWTKGQWKLCFQSRLGPTKWLTPYTDRTVVELGQAGVKCVLIVQPGFTADCLETIDEIGLEAREEFEGAGGEHLVRVPCLNDDPAFIDALAGIVRREAAGWTDAGVVAPQRQLAAVAS